MNKVLSIKVALLLVILVTFTGCKSKQDKSAAGNGTPQEKAAAPSSSPQNNAAAPDMPPQVKVDAQAAALRTLALMESGNFSAIYKDAAAGFKQIGSESQFVAKFKQTRQTVGVLRNPKLISTGILPGDGYVFVYRVENESYNSDIRLTFTRSQSGKMELAGLNQHDELKK